MTLLSAPLELTGDWGASSPEDARVVLSRTREACLGGVRLLSHDQPAELRIEFPPVWVAVYLASKSDPSPHRCGRHCA